MYRKRTGGIRFAVSNHYYNRISNSRGGRRL